jgi:hypothetical protein
MREVAQSDIDPLLPQPFGLIHFEGLTQSICALSRHQAREVCEELRRRGAPGQLTCPWYRSWWFVLEKAAERWYDAKDPHLIMLEALLGEQLEPRPQKSAIS